MNHRWGVWRVAHCRRTHTLSRAALGNHDLGDSDLYATCPEKAPRVTIDGQAYASNQLDASKGGYRPPGGNATMYHLPGGDLAGHASPPVPRSDPP